MPLMFAYLVIILLMLFSTQPIEKFNLMKWITILMTTVLLVMYLFYFIQR